jgi:hypothetical protein
MPVSIPSNPNNWSAQFVAKTPISISASNYSSNPAQPRRRVGDYSPRRGQYMRFALTPATTARPRHSRGFPQSPPSSHRRTFTRCFDPGVFPIRKSKIEATRTVLQFIRGKIRRHNLPSSAFISRCIIRKLTGKLIFDVCGTFEPRAGGEETRKCGMANYSVMRG